MRENIENNRRGFRPKISAIAAVAGLALSGCSTDEDGEFVFAVSCPEEQDVRVREVTTGYKTASINIECGDDEISSAPLSIELVDGDGVTIDESANDGLQQVVVGYEYTTNVLASQNPEIGSIKINDEAGFAQISLRDMYISEVSVSDTADR